MKVAVAHRPVTRSSHGHGHARGDALGRRLRDRFALRQEEGKAAFIAFLTAGDPDLETTARLMIELGRAGVDVIEVGVPFSDPIADGPVIQAAIERSLEQGTTLASVLDLCRAVGSDPDMPPMVLFSYLNPIHRMGYEKFARRVSAAGVDGVLLTDLPIDEPEPLVDHLSERGVATIPLLSPTSDQFRLDRARERGSGFAYCISRTGVTGTRKELAGGIRALVRRVRREVELPVAVGFGISSPDQVHRVASMADGVVVGSAIVDRLTRYRGGDPVPGVGRYVRSLVRACRRSRKEGS